MLDPSILSSSIRGSADFPGGVTWGILCDVIGASYVQFLRSLVCRGTCVGTAGTGSSSGSLLFSVPVITPSFVGISTGRVMGAVLGGTCAYLNSNSSYVGVSAGVGSGVDVSAVLVPPGEAYLSILLPMASEGFRGFGSRGPVDTRFLAFLASSLSSMAGTGVTVPGTGVITGVASPSPASGASVSRIV